MPPRHHQGIHPHSGKNKIKKKPASWSQRPLSCSHAAEKEEEEEAAAAVAAEEEQEEEEEEEGIPRVEDYTYFVFPGAD